MSSFWLSTTDSAAVAMAYCVIVQALPLEALHFILTPPLQQDLADETSNPQLPVRNVGDVDLDRLLARLEEVLKKPARLGAESTSVYYEEAPLPQVQEASETPKRARFHRYPWKRQGQRVPDTPLNPLCKPTREEIFRLLVAVHDATGGTGANRVVNFCNRKRPTSAILGNIRIVDNDKQ